MPKKRRERAAQIAPDSARLQQAARAAVSRRLQLLLAERPRSLAQLSEEAGLGESTVGRITRGLTDPTLSEMVALAAIFNLSSIEELIAPSGTQLLLDHAASDQAEAQVG
ncbi:MAG TPA: helix-turn-helix transcriptional regulator [Acidimicrobiales bacterium]|nr:helix-turn-helix transcriptional regulator [Acidimicrobiales bacterium]